MDASLGKFLVQLHLTDEHADVVVFVRLPVLPHVREPPGGNCIKIGLPGKSILRQYFQENRTSRRPFLLLRISFPGRPIFIQFVPELVLVPHDGVVAGQLLGNLAVMEITPGEAEVISEAGHRLLEMILTFDQSTAGWQFNRIKFIALKIA